MKKTILGLSMAVISTGSMAMTSGAYIGASASLQSFLPQTTIVDIDTGKTNTLSFEQGDTGFAGALAIGYNQFFDNNFSLGINLDGQISNASVNINASDTDAGGTSTYAIKGKYKNSFGASIRPGYLFNTSANGFIVLGYRRAEIDFSVAESGSDSPLTSFSKSQSSNGFEYGIGTEISLDSKVSLRLEVTQTQYDSKSYYTSTDGSATAKTKLNQGSISLVWYPDLYL